MMLMLLHILVCLDVQAGEWRRISDTKIAFEGEIVRGDFASFKSIYRPTDSVIELNSPGGRMDDALDIARVLVENKKLTAIVRGSCFSSCANYLFLAAATRVLDHGVVGYHGNWKAMTEGRTFLDEVAKVPPEPRARLMAFHWKKVREEANFMAKAGVRQELFDRTQNESEDKLYEVYLPSSRLFEYYGIKNVVGEQDLDYARSFKVFFKYEKEISSGAYLAPTINSTK